MLAFEVTLNGKRLCSAGVGAEGVLTAILTWVHRHGETGEECNMTVSGVTSLPRAHVGWIDEDLRVGDEVGIKVLDRTEVDVPAMTKPFNPDDDLEAQKAYVRQMAERFGWRIVSGTSEA
jgi:hypothetical protein